MIRGHKQQLGRAKAIYSYVAKNDDELSIKPGEVINIYKMDLPDEGWWLGELNGKFGLFPDNFVKLVSEPEDRQFQNNNTTDAVPELNKGHTRPALPSKIIGLKLKGQNQKLKEVSKFSVPSTNEGAEVNFDFIKPSNKLTHITAGRVKGPSRRPPSHRSEIPEQIKVPVLRPPLPNLAELDSCWGSGQPSDSPLPPPEPVGRISPPSKFQIVDKKLPPHRNTDKDNSRITNNHRQYKQVGDAHHPITIATSGVESVPIEEYNGMVHELNSLKVDLKEQMQTNERMVQTLRNFLQEERDKIKMLSIEFEKIKKSVISKISFL